MKTVRRGALTLFATALVVGCALGGAAPDAVQRSDAGRGATLVAAELGAPAEGAAGASVPAVQGAPEALSPQATLDLLRAVKPPVRDEVDLVRRFKNACGAPPAAPVPLYRDGTIGESLPFWVLDEPARRYFQVQATLRHTTPHLLLYVQDGTPYNSDALAASARVFEERTYPLLRSVFGALPEGTRITVFNGRVPGVGGYFSANDLVPRSVNPYSNERVMLFMSLDEARPGTPGYDATLAHEIQHLVHWTVKRQQDSWINEGASELAMAVAGYDQFAAARSFLNLPETQLNGWASRPTLAFPHYGGGYLIMEYAAQRLGGYEHLQGLISAPGTSVDTFEQFLAGPEGRRIGVGRFDDLFRDFVIANLLNDRTLADGRFGYERLGVALKARIQEAHNAFPATSGGRLRPYGTRYVELQAPPENATLTVRFSGAGDVPLFGGTARGGRAQWWGNAADEMESTLTRELDLSGVASATLRFGAWYHTEADYDYAGVAVSTDEGCSWQTLAGRHTTDVDPTGQNLGHGLTGTSGGGATGMWVDETMDLTPFAGRKVLLRFFYVTDQSYHGSGFAVDDVSIPEIGFADDAELDSGWAAEGFLRSLNASALDWAVQLVAFTDAGTQVRPVPLTRGPDGRLIGELSLEGFGAGVRRAVVAISPLVPVTQEAADYRLEATIR